jgi:hypothetical protein
MWFMCDLVERIPVLCHAVRSVHANIPEAQWTRLMGAAGARQREIFRTHLPVTCATASHDRPIEEPP